MKVSNHAEAVPQTLLPIIAPKAGDNQTAVGTSKKDGPQIDPADPQGFSRLLPSDAADRPNRATPTDRSGAFKKAAVADKVGAVSRKGFVDKSQAKSGTQVDCGFSVNTSDAPDAPVGPSSDSARPPSTQPADAPATADTLSPDSGTLPADPRLAQTPGELALEAAAIAAVQALAAEPASQPAPTLDASLEKGVVDATSQGGVQSGQAASASNSFLDQLALRTLQASFRPAVAAQAVQADSAAPLSGASTTAQNGSVGLDAQPQASVSTVAPVNTQTSVSTVAPVNTQASVSTVAPVTQTPVSTVAPVNAQTSVSTVAPVNTQTPVSTVAPVNTQTPVSTVAPDNAQTPASTVALGNAQTPVSTQTPVNTQAPVGTRAESSQPAPTLSLSASTGQAAALAVAGKQNLSAADTVAAPVKSLASPLPVQRLASLGGSVSVPDPSQVMQGAATAPALQSNLGLESGAVAPQVKDPASDAGGAIFASPPSGPNGKASVTDTAPELKPQQAPASASATAVGPQSSGSEASGNGSSNGSNDQKIQDRPAAMFPTIPVKVSSLKNSAASEPLAKPLVQSGTLGANDQAVSEEVIATSSQSLDETAPAKSQGAALNSFADNASAVQLPSNAGSGSRHLSEVASKPVVLPPVFVKGNEVWKVVTDALQRARSENPSHLAVELRMDDGSTLGLEVRMSSTGLQASFRSESQTLLKTLEAQWAGFIAKEPTDSKISSATFESHAGLGNFGESSTNGGERRRQMEDASASASLSSGGNGAKPASPSPGAAPKQITPSIRTRDGRMAVYA